MSFYIKKENLRRVTFRLRFFVLLFFSDLVRSLCS